MTWNALHGLLFHELITLMLSHLLRTVFLLHFNQLDSNAW